MNKEQAIKLFEGLIKDSEQAKTVWGLGDTGYYTSEALISAYNLAISVVKVMDVEEQPKQDKVVVSEEEARMIESGKQRELSVYAFLNSIQPTNAPTDDRLASAYINGYTVEQPKLWVVKYLRNRCYYYFVEWANTDTFDPIGGPDLDYLKVAKFTNHAKAEAVATLVDGSVEEV